MVIGMGFATRIKENIKKEINAFKYNRTLENDPDVVRNRLDVERKQIKMQKDALLSKQQLEQDKKELQTLKNSTGIRGKINNGLGALRTHMKNVETRNKSAEKFKLKNPKQERSTSVFEIKGSSGINEVGSGSKGSYRPFGSGVLDQGSRCQT